MRKALVTGVAFVVIVALLALRRWVRQPTESPNLFLTVTSPAAARLAPSQILGALEQVGASASLKRLDETPEIMEAAFLVDFKDVNGLEQFTQKLRTLVPQVKISCLDDRGLIA